MYIYILIYMYILIYIYTYIYIYMYIYIYRLRLCRRPLFLYIRFYPIRDLGRFAMCVPLDSHRNSEERPLSCKISSPEGWLKKKTFGVWRLRLSRYDIKLYMYHIILNIQYIKGPVYNRY